MGRQAWSFYTAGQILFGSGAIREIGEIARRRRWRRLMVVTDPRLLELGLVDRICQPLLEADRVVEISPTGEPEPSLEAAEKTVEAGRLFQPEALLALGGGSNMDLAKMTAILLQHGGRPADYFGFDRVPGPVKPLICVPTTAGTGSEVSHAAVLTDTAAQMKVSALSNYLRPDVAVVDPELTYSCPPTVSADSGIDALTHAIESLTAVDWRELPLEAGEPCAYEGSFPLADVLAEEAIRIMAGSLVPACRPEDPRHLAARDAMAYAALLAGMSFSNGGVALVHALEYPIGGAVHCSHGRGNGLLLPYVMRFNLSHRADKLARVAHCLDPGTQSLPTPDAAEEAIQRVAALKREIGIPERLTALGVTPQMLPEFADKAYAIKRLRQVNPRPSSRDDLLGILESAL